MSDDPIRLSVIGAGQWGPNLIRNFYTSPRCQLLAICDLNERKLSELAVRFPGVALTTRWEEAVEREDLDAVAICTPLSTHHRLAKAALEAGKDVFVEKPLALTIAECEQLIATARERERILMVGHVFKFNPGIRYVKEVLEQGALGQPVSFHAVRTNLGPVRSDTNALWDLASHDLSIFNYWLDAQPTSVTASGLCRLSREREDTVVASYLYPGQVMATVYVSWLHPRKVREITVVGEDKMAIWNDMELSEPVRIYDKGVSQEDIYTDTFGAFRLTLREGPVTIPPVRGKEPLAAECDHFLDCVIQRQQPISDGQDGLQVVRALAGAMESLRSGSRIITL